LQTQQIHRPSETLGLSTQPTPLQKAVLYHFFLHFTLSNVFPTIRPRRSFQTAFDFLYPFYNTMAATDDNILATG
jgi:hypothetical protein